MLSSSLWLERLQALAVGEPGVSARLCHLLAVWALESYLIFLRLWFAISDTGIKEQIRENLQCVWHMVGTHQMEIADLTNVI